MKKRAQINCNVSAETKQKLAEIAKYQARSMTNTIAVLIKREHKRMEEEK